jgi:hypothetical protein
LEAQLTAKKAIISVRLVDESILNSNGTIAEEMLSWFLSGALPAPWVKEVEGVVVRDFYPPRRTTK